MRLLSIETSCDETAIAIVETSGSKENPVFATLSTALYSQVKIHEQYGGVFPALAKREHSLNLIPLMRQALKDAQLLDICTIDISDEAKSHLSTTLSKEPDLYTALLSFITSYKKPAVDAIAVTYGPGLEPALWVGINLARALAYVWNIPVIPVNHMEGHIASILTAATTPVLFPSVALLISGGHTELVKIPRWGEYEIIGETRDDAVGEAFDKVARMLALPYPGGPKVSALAAEFRATGKTNPFTLPRPMLNTPDLSFSFSGLKTAVLYTIKERGGIAPEEMPALSCAFEDAVVDVLLHKTKKAILASHAQSLIIGGGVIANSRIREAFSKLTSQLNITLHVPEMALATDNAVMIALAGYLAYVRDEKILKTDPSTIVAKGSLRLN